jgi:mannose-6-phosphate isomerase-like protein (cupin superfamily)
MPLRTFALIAALSTFAAVNAPAQELVPTKDPGVSRASLIINPGAGVDVLRLEFQPGAARSVHQHDDVRFHLFLSMSGSIEVTVGSTKTMATPGQAFFIEKGTPHGFRNTGTTPAKGFEIFIRDPKPDSKADLGDALKLAMSLAR